jgi:hypothetical protein
MRSAYYLCLIAIVSVFLVLPRAWASDIELDDFGDVFNGAENAVDDYDEPSPKSVTMFNKLSDEDVIVYWEDPNDEQDVELFRIDPNQMVEVSTTVGHSFHAITARTGRRTSPFKVTIVPDVSSYAFGPSRGNEPAAAPLPREPVRSTKSTDSTRSAASAGSTRHADIDRNFFKHPSIKPIGRTTTSMAAKFRCLVPKMDYWYVLAKGVCVFINAWNFRYDDGKDGVYQGSLTFGKESTTNTYEGHVFYFTEPGDKSKELARFTMDADRVIYAVSNPKYPVPQDQKYLLEQEYKFMEEYKNRTGIHWRHFFGYEGSNKEPGPRGPPTLHMWKAHHLGEKFEVTSTHGYWWVLFFVDCYG